MGFCVLLNVHLLFVPTLNGQNLCDSNHLFVLLVSKAIMHYFVALVLFLLAFYSAKEVEPVCSDAAGSTKPLKPIILIAGYNANRLEAKLDREEVRYDFCQRKSDGWFDIWLNPDDYDEKLVYCFMDNMSLRYDQVTRKTYNQPGVQIRARFNQTSPVEYLSADHNLTGSPYFNVLVQRLVDIGYERNKNILGAAYDFRKAPNELGLYFIMLRELIERAYSDNGQQPVVIVCHSMGCLNALYFLQRACKSWKSRYISLLISMSGAYGGAVPSLNVLIAGSNSNIVVLPNLKRIDTPTWPSSTYLLPSPAVFPADQVLVKDIKNQYTSNDYEKLYGALQYPVSYELYRDVKDLTPPEQPPGVKVYCVHGYGIKTIEQLVYESSEIGRPFNENVTLVYGEGDGTVNLQSLRACLDWQSTQVEPVYYRNFSPVDHEGILRDESAFEYLKEALQSNNQ